MHFVVLYQVHKQSLSYKGLKGWPCLYGKTWYLCLGELGGRQHLFHFPYCLKMTAARVGWLIPLLVRNELSNDLKLLEDRR